MKLFKRIWRWFKGLFKKPTTTATLSERDKFIMAIGAITLQEFNGSRKLRRKVKDTKFEALMVQLLKTQKDED